MAAGLGFKTFATGDVLSAADTNGYLMQGVLVFASAAARDSAITSPQEGQFAYLKDTNVTTYYTGSAWANLDTTGMTNPMTTTGDTIYSSSGSTPARLGIGSTGQVLTVAAGIPSWATPAVSTPSFIGCRAYISGDTSVANSTDVIVAFNNENFDTNSFHDNATNNSRITIPTGYAGKYLVNYGLYWGSFASTERKGQLLKNGTAVWNCQVVPSSGAQTQDSSVVLSLAVGDYLQLNVTQSSGSTQTLLGSSSIGYQVTSLGVTYLGA